MIKSRFFAAPILATALAAPAAIPQVLSSPAVAGEAASREFSDLAGKVAPAGINVPVTTNIGSGSALKAAVEPCISLDEQVLKGLS
jgi:hypothetical protein